MGSKSPTLPSALKEFFTNVLLSLMGASSASSAQLTEKCSVTASHLSQSNLCVLRSRLWLGRLAVVQPLVLCRRFPEAKQVCPARTRIQDKTSAHPADQTHSLCNMVTCRNY